MLRKLSTWDYSWRQPYGPHKWKTVSVVLIDDRIVYHVLKRSKGYVLFGLLNFAKRTALKCGKQFGNSSIDDLYLRVRQAWVKTDCLYVTREE